MAGQQGVRAGRAFVELYSNDSKLTKGLKLAQRKLAAFGKQVTTLGKSLVKTASLAAAPLALSLKIGAQFEDQMSKIKAVTAGTEAEFTKLNETAKELGRTTSFTASAVAEAMVELGRAGFSRSEIDKAIAGILSLSRATDTEVPEAAAIAGAALRQFGMEAEDMGQVVDVLTATANGSAQTLADLGEALRPVGPIAAEAGESIEEVNAAIGVLANNGIKGSLAGNSLARAYKNLSDETKQGALRDLGVEAVDSAGNLRPLATIISELGEKTKDFGTAAKLASFETLFGRGQAAALKLAGSGAVFEDLLKSIQESSGLAAKTAEEMDNNLGGAFRKLQSAAEGVAIAISTKLSGSATGLIDKITEVLGSVTEWIMANGETVKSIAALILKVGAAGAGLVVFGKIASVLSVAMGALLSPVTLVVTALAAIAAAAYKVEQETGALSDIFNAMLPTIEKVGSALKVHLIDILNGMAVALAEVVETVELLIAAYDKLAGIQNNFLENNQGAIPGGIVGMMAEGEANQKIIEMGRSGKPLGKGGKPASVKFGSSPPGATTPQSGSNPIASIFRAADEAIKQGALAEATKAAGRLAGGLNTAMRGPQINAVGEGGTLSSMSQLQFSNFAGNAKDDVSDGDRHIVTKLGAKLDKVKDALDNWGVLG